MLTSYEQQQLDVDWYCLINGYPSHIASMGGYIPAPFCYRYDLRDTEDAVIALPDMFDIELNEGHIYEAIQTGYGYIERLDNLGPSDNYFSVFIEGLINRMPSCDLNGEYSIAFRLYASSFVHKARKGFYSYARVGESGMYELVASPLQSCNIRDCHIYLKSLYNDGTSRVVNRMEINASHIIAWSDI